MHAQGLGLEVSGLESRNFRGLRVCLGFRSFPDVSEGTKNWNMMPWRGGKLCNRKVMNGQEGHSLRFKVKGFGRQGCFWFVLFVLATLWFRDLSLRVYGFRL